jgi:hypothetical protein
MFRLLVRLVIPLTSILGMEKNLLNMEKIFVFRQDRYDVECVVAKQVNEVT